MTARLKKNVEALRQRLGDYPAHVRTILDGVTASFGDESNPLRFSNTATGLRELLREFFEFIAPDNSIKQCAWFKPDLTSRTGVTRRHRTLFSVYSYVDPAHFPLPLVGRVDDLANQIGKDVDQLSRLTHITSKTLSIPLEAATQLFESTLNLFLLLFEEIEKAREHLDDLLEIELQEALSELFSSEFFDELDILSTHTRPQFAEDVEVEVDEIGKDTISFTGTGSILCQLQYGSDGDCRRGDGLEFEDSYPFKFSGEAVTQNPKSVKVDRQDVTVDTSSFYE